MHPAPLLLIDVDGVISLFGFPPAERPDGSFLLVDGIPHLISSTAGGHLRTLAGSFELVWCTGWEEKANDYLPLALGLPGPLPYLTFDAPDGRHVPGRAGPGGNVQGHWKLAAIDAHAGPDRALAWVDDRLDEACERWAAARPGDTLLVGTDPAVGLTGAHVARLLAWARRRAAARHSS